MEAAFLKKRFTREKAARIQAEQILEEKSLELYFKNKELKRLNERLNSALAASEDQLDDLKKEHFELFENSIVGVALTQKGVILQVNHTFTEMLGYDKEEIVGKTISDISYHDDVEPSMQQTKELYETDIKKFSMQKRYIRKNGSFFWGSTNVSEVKNKEGETKYHLAVIVNIHNEKIAEKRLNQTVEQLKEKNENLESFAHIVSHDLRAPLNGINTILGWIGAKELDMETEGLVGQMKERVVKMNSLIEGIIAYSRVSRSQEERIMVDVGEVIDEAIMLLQVPLNIKIVKEGSFPIVYVNKAKLLQVFSNLIDNAVRHNDKTDGLVKIVVKEDKDYYHFTVWDNGEGIEEAHFSKIFQIFNTLTQKGTGSGIGLSLVKRIVEELGGSISVDSKTGFYTKFQFNLAKEICIYVQD